MIAQNSNLAASNNHKDGYHEGADDVLIALDDMISGVRDAETQKKLMEFFDILCRKFPTKSEE